MNLYLRKRLNIEDFLYILFCGDDPIIFCNEKTGDWTLLHRLAFYGYVNAIRWLDENCELDFSSYNPRFLLNGSVVCRTALDLACKGTCMDPEKNGNYKIHC
eukprot:TRINITY_DN8308_c0_g1_i1.p1 TRINITY_DN8308_c0_g1~~TRINITY_DN8308_c0_g1_i1.p1  ORF type:complete len:102 (+),score=11.23 TRINITY_DN8308_c0_g1_i1:97-402(+)